MHIADRSLYLGISRLLWAFDFRRVVSPHNLQEIIPDMNSLVDGVMSFPKPFAVDIVPRSDEKAHTVRKEWMQALLLLDEKSQWKSVPGGLIWKDEQLAD